MKILFIAPLPPPIHGQALAADVFYQGIKEKHHIELVDTKKESHTQGANSLKRFYKVFTFLLKVVLKKRNSDLVYLQISESLSGNIKDLVIYLICFDKLHNMYIHLHGGSIGRLLFDRRPLIKKINSFFISRLAGIIVLGHSHRNIFSGLISNSKIHIVPNFAADYLFASQEEITERFTNVRLIKILYLSNLTKGKGYLNLLEAFQQLDKSTQDFVQIDFAGAFENKEAEEKFLKAIHKYPQLKYHGIVKGDEKKKLLHSSHVFCLPTSYLEGQPISILEAYAAGCIVVTTMRGGIIDIFEDQLNGFEIPHDSVTPLTDVIQRLVREKQSLLYIALKNNTKASSKFRTSVYNRSLETIMKL